MLASPSYRFRRVGRKGAFMRLRHRVESSNRVRLAASLFAVLTISLGAKLVPFSLRLKFQRAIPMSVFLLAVLLILRGMSLGVPYLSPDLSQGSCCH